MSPTQAHRSAIHSSLAADPELGDLVAQFVAAMPTRVAWLERHLRAGDWEALRRGVHQLKGASASYGFDGLTPHALHTETLLNQGATPAEVAAALRALVIHCRSVTAEPAN